MTSRARWSLVFGMSLFASVAACTAEEEPSDGGASACRGERCAAGADGGSSANKGGSSSKGGSSNTGGSSSKGGNGSGDGGSASVGGSSSKGGSSNQGGASNVGGNDGTGGSGANAKGGTGSGDAGSAGDGGTNAKGGGSGTGGAAPGKGGSSGTGAGGSTPSKGGGSGTGGSGAGTGGSDATGDEWEVGRQLCVDKINEYRATVNKAPLERWKAGEACADKQAANDAASGKPHEGFQTIKCGGGGGQNECPGYATVPGGLLQCLAQMWAEGPTPDGTWDIPHGHYMNMFGDYTYMGFTQHFDRVACGFAKAPNGGVWSVQNFQ